MIDRAKAQAPARLMRRAWNANLALFNIVLFAFALALHAGALVGALFAAAVMLASFAAGAYIALRVREMPLRAFSAF